ncbi:MAG: class I SAM-dependent methyltransferase [Alloprevotella sp.]|nr:class I SAM-dependent methyltransferase [Prevotella sp.]MBR1712772.1 class I SAM-dependent methyltransferase [Alloprevotella sp.]
MNMERLEGYMLSNSTAEHPYLHRLYRATQTQLLRPRMASGHLQGLFLKMVAQLVNPRLVLEIGTYSGYSALALASGMMPGSKLITYEINDEQEDFTRPWLEGSPFPAVIEMRIGDVLELLPAAGEADYDMVFIDGNKRDYVKYYDLVLPRLRSGGIILADNTLWDGHIADAAYNDDPQTQGILAFNARVAADDSVEKLILPLRDGLTVIRKK